MKRACVAAALCFGCTRNPAARAPEPDTAPHSAVDEASALASAAPLEGVPIELEIPLVSGDSESLATLRGKVVVLMLSSSDRPGWSAFRSHFEARLKQIGRDRLVVVAVANDADAEQLKAEWDRDPPPFLLGWDPGGALALRLVVAALPAVFVLGPEGKSRGNLASIEPDALARVDAWIDAALPPR
ncbi:MAG: redoxin domain-containing protein [Nannocystaceae bacterium]|nr:redoxin domain-containing protein [Nannocystaceae bacterium]